VALVLLWRLRRQQRNKGAVLAVATLLLGIAGWLTVLELTHHTPAPPTNPPAPQSPASDRATPSGPIV
jgi:hypothetical protein